MASNIQYVDGIGSVRVANGMAHIELVVVTPPTTEGGQMAVQPVQHLIMALPQFVRFCSDMASQLNRMEEKGMITRKQPDAPVA